MKNKEEKIGTLVSTRQIDFDFTRVNELEKRVEQLETNLKSALLQIKNIEESIEYLKKKNDLK